MKFKALLLCILIPVLASATPIDSLREKLTSTTQVQEKVYVHTDNTCYFIGDTLWYKAYVVRSDNLHPTNLSRILYVELINPDGIVVERQRVIAGENGNSCGQFELKDSLYSGYYELRAYTRWQLNFNSSERYHSFSDRWKFISNDVAEDFFRDYEGLYSRVIPVYNKPREKGDYANRYMTNRPRQQILTAKDYPLVSFYPEGGSLVEGLPCRLAFEVHDNHGMALDIEGTLPDGTILKPTHFGRGVVTYTPSSDSATKVVFTYSSKKYTFHLPKIQSSGATISYSPESRIARISSRGLKPAAYAVLCRGRLVSFDTTDGSSSFDVDLSSKSCPTGINELIIYDTEAHPIASRLFFINNHDYGKTIDARLTSAGNAVDKTTTLQPFSPLQLDVTRGDESTLRSFSIAIRDGNTEEPGYNDGNIMTDMLLSSELKGFIAHPAYYFESEDKEHTDNLDLLMMVQGWRRYKDVKEYKYAPETSFAIEGKVYKLPSSAYILSIDDITPDGSISPQTVSLPNPSIDSSNIEAEAEAEGEGGEAEVVYESYAVDDNQHSKAPKKPVYVEAELVFDGKSYGAISTMEKNGNFRINLPPFYDKGILFMKAYNVTDSVRKCMQSDKIDKHRLDESSYPDYLVKRNMFYPIFTKPYSWYQVNAPELEFIDEEEDEQIPENSRLAGNHQLQTVIVKKKRRGKRGIDKTKPALVRDAYELYNDMTDYGLMQGTFDVHRFAKHAGTFLYGNMNREKDFNVRFIVDGASVYRNYRPVTDPSGIIISEFDMPRSTRHLYDLVQLKRMQDIRIYTDYELRTDSGIVHEEHTPAITFEIIPIPDNGQRYTYRDRRIILDGFTYPEEFYSPDYGKAIPEEPEDYRRTLYWNPNAKFDEQGRFSAILYNNGKETRVRVSAAGIDSAGQFYYKQ